MWRLVACPKPPPPPGQAHGAAIPDEDLGSGGVQMTCVGPSHIAESGESDLVSCEWLVHDRCQSHTGAAAYGKSSLPPKFPMKSSHHWRRRLPRLAARKQASRTRHLAVPLRRQESLEDGAAGCVFSAENQHRCARETGGRRRQRPRDDFQRHRQPGTDTFDVIFHLASMVSGECEERFDDALRVNLDGGRNHLRSGAPCCGRQAASGVCEQHGLLWRRSAWSQMMSRHARSSSPQTTYGMTKAMCELLVNDHTRKGHFDGRSVRLPTVIVRPGKPNAAASSWASGMFREPLNGEACLLPIRRDQPPSDDRLRAPWWSPSSPCSEVVGVQTRQRPRLRAARAHRVTPANGRERW
jgi:hypothetical protein